MYNSGHESGFRCLCTVDYHFGNVIYFTAKERLKEEANNMILDDKNELFVKNVHVNRAATDDTHKMLRKKWEKMNNDELTVWDIASQHWRR